ncbi:hypothetical protein BDZ89DRAFT_1036947 [Hymenopellis radicata]|nr:hypothetical protein BDZ89DRAFT_1036947 [Hymenopellis radicata]
MSDTVVRPDQPDPFYMKCSDDKTVFAIPFTRRLFTLSGLLDQAYSETVASSAEDSSEDASQEDSHKISGSRETPHLLNGLTPEAAEHFLTWWGAMPGWQPSPDNRLECLKNLIEVGHYLEISALFQFAVRELEHDIANCHPLLRTSDIILLSRRYSLTSECWISPIHALLSPDHICLEHIDSDTCEALGLCLYRIIAEARERYHIVRAEMALTVPELHHAPSCSEHDTCYMAFIVFWTSKVVLKIFGRGPHYTYKTARELLAGNHIPFMNDDCKSHILSTMDLIEDAISKVRYRAENACVHAIDPAAPVPHPEVL